MGSENNKLKIRSHENKSSLIRSPVTMLRDKQPSLPVTVTAFKWLCPGVLPEVSGQLVASCKTPLAALPRTPVWFLTCGSKQEDWLKPALTFPPGVMTCLFRSFKSIRKTDWQSCLKPGIPLNLLAHRLCVHAARNMPRMSTVLQCGWMCGIFKMQNRGRGKKEEAASAISHCWSNTRDIGMTSQSTSQFSPPGSSASLPFPMVKPNLFWSPFISYVQPLPLVNPPPSPRSLSGSVSHIPDRLGHSLAIQPCRANTQRSSWGHHALWTFNYMTQWADDAIKVEDWINSTPGIDSIKSEILFF